MELIAHLLLEIKQGIPNRGAQPRPPTRRYRAAGRLAVS
jgi:hypothetical protein